MSRRADVAASTWRDALALWWYRRKVAKQARRLHERTRHLRCVAHPKVRVDPFHGCSECWSEDPC